MEGSFNWRGNVLHGQSQEPNQRKRPPAKAKSFDTLVARYYPAVYSFACRFSDDPRKTAVLARDAFNSTRKQLQTCCDENVLASILISNVIRAGLPLESNLTQTAQPKRKNNNFGRRYAFLELESAVRGPDGRVSGEALHKNQALPDWNRCARFPYK